MSGSNHVVGTRPPRADATEKVTGRAPYVGDVRLPGLLYGGILRSPIPHGRIVRLDASRALAMPGVEAVVTGTDVRALPQPFYGHVVKDRPVLAIDVVRHVGEAVAAVAAESPLVAEAALDAMDVEYAELPALLDPAAALTPGVPRIHSDGYAAGDFGDVQASGSGANVCFLRREERGDVDAAFQAAHRMIEEEYSFPAVFQWPLEPFTCVADWLPDGGLQVWSTSQHPFLVRATLCGIFGLAVHQIRVITPYLGGGFGSKGYTMIDPIVVLLSRKAGRPVQVALSAAETCHTTHRHAAHIALATAVSADGRLLGRKARIELDTGAYADNGPRVATRAAHRLLGAYITPAYRVESLAVYTHNVPAGSYRSIGGAQTIWATESHMDAIAAALELDPVQLRLQNLPERGGIVMAGRKPLDADLKGDLRRLAAALPPPASLSPPASGGSVSGRGLAIGVAGAGAGPVSSALVRLQADGSVLVQAGSTEMGQGAQTVMAMICAEALGVSLEHVRCLLPDTEGTPYNRSTGSSRSTTVVGSAVQLAAADLRRQVLEIAADMVECDPVDLKVQDGCVIAPDGRTYPLADVVRFFFGMRGGELMGRGYTGARVPNCAVATDPVFWEVGMGAAEVEVDLETGQITLRQYITLAEAGRVIHPGLTAGQELGAFAQGLGHTLFEEARSENGQFINANLVDYRVPTTLDMPGRFSSITVENGDGPGPFGAKGLGEGALMPVAPAVGNAVYRATGRRLRSLPLTPERVWRALRGER